MDLISKVLEVIRVRTPLISQINASGDHTIDMQQADGAPFHFVLAGAVDLIIDGRHYRLEEGDMALLPRWDRYLLQIGRGAEPRSIVEIIEERALPLWSAKEGIDQPLSIDLGDPVRDVRVLSGIVGFRPQEVGLTVAAFPQIIVFPRGERMVNQTMRVAYELFLQELEHCEPGFTAVAARSLELFCVQALRNWLLQSGHPQGLARGINNPQISRALQSMYADPGDDWTLERLAQVAGQSRSAFAAAFLQAMGETPFAHLRGIRLRLAAAQLRSGDKSVEQIASGLGYASSASFVTAFRREFGATPSTYRRQCKAEAQGNLTS